MLPQTNNELEESRLLGMEHRRSSTDRRPPAPASSIFASYFSRKFFQGAAVLFPIVISMYLTYWFIEVFDSFFSPLYQYLLGFHVFGLGAITSMLFIFATGVFTSGWIGSKVVGLGDYLIRKLPIVKQIYNAAKQVSSALTPDDESTSAMKEACIVKHPRLGEHAFGFITGHTRLITSEGDIACVTVYIPTNHVYVGDVFLLQEKDVIRCKGLDVNTGLQVLVSAGLAVPPVLEAVGSLSK